MAVYCAARAAIIRVVGSSFTCPILAHSFPLKTLGIIGLHIRCVTITNVESAS
jgi:hypothetical protein